MPRRPRAASSPSNGATVGYEAELWKMADALRALRSRLAEKGSVPAFVIFSDASLRQMAREYPRSDDEFMRISGVGRQKLRALVPTFQQAIAEHPPHQSRPHVGQAS